MTCVMKMDFFCFKQKTAYEMRISDWSSDVCSSDLPLEIPHPARYSLQHDNTLERSAMSQIESKTAPSQDAPELITDLCEALLEIGRASCRDRVCQYV